ncbi:type IV pilus secretin PilQ [Pseudolysobacter antarcticus]|uniref:Type IV pilus secretin PilQ n=2 Tax=Pseudolysobacter antarcticus TaxID=2511995 RepID=A0A411HQI2_9GAMM|nr:type IV pilus secretin PilQ [Pseudolysobacter antarcticus]
MPRLGVLLALLLGIGVSVSAYAENVLQDVSYVALPGGKVEITLKLATPPPPPQVFATEAPPRIALDLAATHNAVTQRHIDIGTGATSGISIVEAGGRTRVVVDLFHPSTYETRVEGSNLVLAVGTSGGNTPVTAAMASTDPTKSVALAGSPDISNIDFRRGKAGEGRIIVDFSAAGAAADLRREGDKIVIDVRNAHLPAKLAQHLDVMDFATPVHALDIKPNAGGARIEISAASPFEQLAYQTGNQYIVEIALPRDKSKDKKDKNQEPEYNGSRVTFNFQDIPTRSVLQLIADVSDLNIVVSDTVQGNVTLRLINVPWDQALDLVLQAKDLDKRRKGNVIWVAPQKQIADREQSIAAARQKLEQQAELISDYIPISYGHAKDIAGLLTDQSKTATAGGAGGSAAPSARGFLSERGTVSFDERTNTLLVNDTPDRIRDVRELIALLDRPVRQVLIESRIVIASDNFSRELGAKFGISGAHQDGNGNVISTSGTLSGADQMTNAALVSRSTGTGRSLPVGAAGAIGGGVLVPSLANALNVNLPASTPSGSFGLAILGADYLLDLELSASQKEGRSEVISSPRVITANNQEAIIKQGTEIGYLTIQAASTGSSSALPTVAFKDAVLELRVTPTITADNRVYLAMHVKKDSLNSFISIPGGGVVPQIDTREINTSVLVDNAQTVVLGGVYEATKIENVNKVPFLGDLPAVGLLFRDKSNSNNKAELLIFVTPRILSDTLK